MKKFQIELMEYNKSGLTEDKIKRILNEALKNYNAGEVIRVKEIK